ncbi:MAG: hemin uptake protein HemP [Gammaproteobacteria bacterium]|nr:MAG: hemin uptake protein HemP [Gammaproteobacteria bacterium]
MLPDPPPNQVSGLRVVPVRDDWVDSHLLLAGKPLHIRHGSDTYQLRITRQGKLILTK